MRAMADTGWNLVVATEATFEPVTLAAVKKHLREDGDDQNDHIYGLIHSATAQMENVLDRALATQTLELRLDAFPRVIELPRSPAQSVTSISYIDSDGASQTLAADQYTVDVKSEPARIVPAYNVTWPSTRNVPNAVTVTYVAGYTEGMCPYDLQQSLMMRVARDFGFRGDESGEDDREIDRKEAPYRVWWL